MAKLKSDAGIQEAKLAEKQEKANHALNMISSTMQGANTKKEQMESLRKEFQTKNDFLNQRRVFMFIHLKVPTYYVGSYKYLNFTRSKHAYRSFVPYCVATFLQNCSTCVCTLITYGSTFKIKRYFQKLNGKTSFADDYCTFIVILAPRYPNRLGKRK